MVSPGPQTIPVHPLASGFAPAWASEWGEDRYGPFCCFRIGNATQRLRWIPRGSFLMGSPADDKERLDWEFPEQRVTIGGDFWIFDTPCTQALWKAVMGENPSQFEGDDRPVEKVNWHDCQQFFGRLNSQLDDLELSLPSEAQWEYACRAGTTTSRYEEDLDAIAWYFKNSDNQTHPVGEKSPNAWGLYDMLGNVFEWCQNRWTDPSKHDSEQASAHRVVRGGSWLSNAQDVRAADRYHNAPSGRYGNLGFRGAQFQEPS